MTILLIAVADVVALSPDAVLDWKIFPCRIIGHGSADVEYRVEKYAHLAILVPPTVRRTGSGGCTCQHDVQVGDTGLGYGTAVAVIAILLHAFLTVGPYNGRIGHEVTILADDHLATVIARHRTVMFLHPIVLGQEIALLNEVNEVTTVKSGHVGNLNIRISIVTAHDAVCRDG